MTSGGITSDKLMARAFWSLGDGAGEIRAESFAPPGPGEALVETIYSGISKGTETLVFRGGVPESEWRRMRCPFQAGDFPGPVKYGYAAVGRVLAGDGIAPGRPVFALYPHQTAFVLPSSWLVPVPDDVPAERAVLAANMETALNAVWDADGLPAERVAVIGAGIVGLLTGYLVHRLTGASVTAIDPEPSRAGVAAALGLDFRTPTEAAGEFPLIFHASGNPAGLVRALDLAAFEATVVELSWYGTREATLPLGGAFHSRRLTLKASQVGAVAPSRRDKVSHRERLVEALSLLRDPALDVLVSGESPFEDLPGVMAGLASGSPAALCHRIRYTL